MSSTNTIRYLDLPIDLKNQIQERLKENKKLKTGFYSQDYNILLNGRPVYYRFHAVEENGSKTIKIKFESDISKHNPYSKNNNVYFYDSKLKTTLHVKKAKLDEIFEKEIDFNLSTEQKELLAHGHDITLNVTSNYKIKNNEVRKISKNELKNFVADYTFFLGKCSLFIVQKSKTGPSINLTLNKNNF